MLNLSEEREMYYRTEFVVRRLIYNNKLVWAPNGKVLTIHLEFRPSEYLARSCLTFVCKMAPIASAGRKQWLNNHSTRKVYKDIPEKVTKLCNGASSATSKFKKLA